MSQVSSKPNFLIIVADDLGYSDLGAYGSEIATPNLDKLASQGLKFTQFYAAAACSPTRSMLLTGTDNHIAGVGAMWEFARTQPKLRQRPGYEGHLNDRVAALPEILSDNGYETFLSGKWHLGLTPETSPAARGFQRSFSLLPGAANHFGWEPQLVANKDKPGLLQSTTSLHAENGKYVTDLPDDFYSSDFYGSKLVDYLDTRDRSKPFFAYLPFTAPHWPLQAPQDIIKKYKGFYDEGPEKLRIKRLTRLIELGLLDKSIKPHEIVAPDSTLWDNLSEDQKAKSARAMEVYAAMVERLDWNVGRVFDQLQKTGDFDNTFILFISDNGAEGASYEARPILGSISITDYVAKYFNNHVDNIGNKDSYVWYGPRWAQAATAPSWLYKMFASEGGIHVPAILKAPGLVGSGKVTNTFSTVMDILPTVLDLAGISNHNGKFRGKEVAKVRGKSLVKALSDKTVGTSDEDKFAVHDTDETIGWELFGHAAIRRGDWKITFIQAPVGPNRWQLFNLATDPGETVDLSEQEPKIFKDLLQEWEIYKESAGVAGLVSEIKELPEPDPIEDDLLWMKYERVIAGTIKEEVLDGKLPNDTKPN